MADGQNTSSARTPPGSPKTSSASNSMPRRPARRRSMLTSIPSWMRSTTSLRERRGVRGQFRAEGRPVTHASGLPAHFMRPGSSFFDFLTTHDPSL